MRGGEGSSCTGDGPLILGLGMATVDFLTVVPRLPGADEVFPLERLEVQGGGPVATALAAATRLGGRSAFVGAIGDDSWADVILNDFRKFGVDSGQVVCRQGGTSPHSVILVEAGTGKRSILYSKGDLEGLKAAELPHELIRQAGVLHLDGFDIEAATAAARVARSAGVPVSLDGGAGEPWPGLEGLLPSVDLLVVAAQFARHLSGEEEPEAALPHLLGRGARHAVITDGARGSWFASSDGESGHVPAFPVKAVDTTGAGDAFHGAYLHAYLGGEPIAACVRFASAAGALQCTTLGGRSGLPTEEQVRALISESGVIG